MSRNYSKDFHHLLKDIKKVSNGQARVTKWDDEDLSLFDIEIEPSDGLYKNGKFTFSITVTAEDYPCRVPEIMCRTPIYHPNIDMTGDSGENTNVCVSFLDEWEETNDLVDCVQVLLFLFYNPNLEDPLCPLFDGDTSEEYFQENVRTSLEGGEVEDIRFETNYGYIENGVVVKKNNESEEKIIDVTEEKTDCVPKPECPPDVEDVTIDQEKQTSKIISNDEEIEENRNEKSEIMKRLETNPDFKQGNDEVFIENCLAETDKTLETNSDLKQANRQDTVKERFQEEVKDGTLRKIFLDKTTTDKYEFSMKLDCLVPCSTIISVLCRHLVRKFSKWRSK